MVFHQLKSLLEQFPKLMDCYTKYLNQGYKLTNITMNSSNHDLFYFQEVRIICNYNIEKQVLITSHIFENKERVFEYDLSSNSKEIFPGIKLNADVIYNKSFKRNFFGGY